MNPTISVIVPIYKVEKYLDKCINSIINQTYKNLEIILVDDGSPDKCPQICDEYAKKDGRIKVIHKPNGGLSDARNAGMKIASGGYISFIDSDDWIELNMLESLYENINKTNSDIASCGVKMVWDDGRPDQILTNLNGYCILNNTEDALNSLISTEHLIQTVWNKLYKKQIIQDIFFPVGKINEDEYWTWRAIAASSKVVCIDTPLYNYRQRSGSIMQGGEKFNPLLVIEASCEKYDYIEKNFPKLKGKCCVNLIYLCLFQAQRSKLILPKKKHKEYYKDIKKIVKQHNPSSLYLKSLGIKKRIRVKSIYHFFGLTCALQNLLGIGNQSNIG